MWTRRAYRIRDFLVTGFVIGVLLALFVWGADRALKLSPVYGDKRQTTYTISTTCANADGSDCATLPGGK